MNANDVITIAKTGLSEGGRQAAIDAVYEQARSVTEYLPEVEPKERIAAVVDAMLAFDSERALALAEQGIEEMSRFLVSEDEDEDSEDEDEDSEDSERIARLDERIARLDEHVARLDERAARLERVARERGLL